MSDSMRFKLVPVEPTDEMIVAFAEAWYSKRQTIDDPDMLDAYRDMLAVAPDPNVSPVAQVVEHTVHYDDLGFPDKSVKLREITPNRLELGDFLYAAPPQPTYDETKELAACRAEWEKRILAGPFGNAPFPDFWIGWLACAQSRAKAGEVGHA